LRDSEPGYRADDANIGRAARVKNRPPTFYRFFAAARSLSGLPAEIASSAGILSVPSGIRLDRLLKQRFALRKPDSSAASRSFKEFVSRGGLPRDALSISCRSFIPGPTNS